MAVVMCGKKSEKWKMENGAGSDLEVTASWEMKGAGGGVCGGGGGVQTVRTDRRTGLSIDSLYLYSAHSHGIPK